MIQKTLEPENDIHLIIKLIDKDLSEEEVVTIRKKIKSDPQFREEIKLNLKAYSTLKAVKNPLSKCVIQEEQLVERKYGDI